MAKHTEQAFVLYAEIREPKCALVTLIISITLTQIVQFPKVTVRRHASRAADPLTVLFHLFAGTGRMGRDRHIALNLDNKSHDIVM